MTNTLEHRNPRFLCISLSDGSTLREMPLHHEVGGEPPGAGVEILEADDPLRLMLEQVSSLRLYCDNLSDASAFYIAHPDEWEELRTEFEAWSFGREHALPEWVSDAIVFAEVPNSGVYYLYSTGNDKGCIFEYSGDGDELIKVSGSLDEFLTYICTPCDDLIADIQTYTRFSDGSSDTQWLPQKYLHD